MPLTTKESGDLSQRTVEIQKALKAGAVDQARELVEKQLKATEEISRAAVSQTETESDPAVFEHIWKGNHAPGSENDEFQKACDDLYLVASCLGMIDHKERGDNSTATVSRDVLMLKSHRLLRVRFPKQYEQAKQAAKYAEKVAKSSGNNEEIAKALYTTGTALGDEWVPTHHSPSLERLVRLEAKIAPLFRHVKMPTDNFILPVQGALPNVLILNEATTNTPTAITKGNTATASTTLATKKYGLAVPFSVELTEDSIIPIVESIRSELAETAAHDWDYTILNGDTSNPHQDSDVDTSTHRGRGLIGLRKMVQSAASIDGTTFTLGDIRTMRANMAAYGADPSQLVFITSVAGYMRMLGLSQVVTLDVFGPKASVLNGQLGAVDGIPIVVSTECRQDLNASGVYNATTTTNTIIVCANRKAFVQGTRREVTVKLWSDKTFDQDQLILTYRKDFKNTVSYTANLIVGQVYGIANAGA